MQRRLRRGQRDRRESKRVWHHRCHRKTFKEEEMVNSVKCRGEVKEDKKGKMPYLFI